ncbi:uncharacterized protein KY384_000150 [Bacidia gigantensis]|uniref:uncharacterized protein n=1 Tax=Bacidia gigantensis TaxID=2732470 RepID=UPI001D050392|nr:uncharacterized protein KY384_000150 [Bacidia gigantensis]KAG8526157.1 hypothetical protein KY384_000150 [Bacidia gigantensis]
MNLEDYLEDQQLSLAHRIVLGRSSRDLQEVLRDQPELAKATDYHNRSALWWAALRHDIHACRTLLCFNANPNNADYQGETLMQNDAGTSYTEILEMLVTAGGSIGSDDALKETPLHYAARSDSRIENTYFLLGNGANASATNANGVTAMHEALQVDAVDTAELLINYDVNLNAEDMYGDYHWHLAITL